MGPGLLAQMLPMDGQMGSAPARPPDPFGPYDPALAAPVPAAEAEKAEKLRIIEGLLNSGQLNDVYGLAMQDAQRPNMYMFDRSGGLRGAVDTDKRMGYGALASLLGADADRYGQNMADQQFQDELDFRQLPYQQMTVADREMADLRRQELQQRATEAMMPYERMTPFEQGTIDVERERLLSPRGGGLSEFDQQIIASDPAMQSQYRSQLQQRIFGDAPPPAPGALRDQMADQVNDNEVMSAIGESVGELNSIDAFSKAADVAADVLFSQVRSGNRSDESALKAAEEWDSQSPAGSKSAVQQLKRKRKQESAVNDSIMDWRKKADEPFGGWRR